jgi:hypothetical protein
MAEEEEEAKVGIMTNDDDTTVRRKPPVKTTVAWTIVPTLIDRVFCFWSMNDETRVFSRPRKDCLHFFPPYMANFQPHEERLSAMRLFNLG